MAFQELCSRIDIAASFSRLKRVRPTVPFWHLAAHRTPTLWSLYRGLLRAAPHEPIRWRIRTLFQARKNLTSPLKTKVELERGYRWLALFQSAAHGERHAIALLGRYNRMIASKREREHWKSIFREELRWMHKLQNRAILTGALVRPSLYNRPFPRMKPQPIHVSRMIWNRRRVRELRLDKQEMWKEWKDDLRRERDFEASLYEHAQGNGFQFEKIYDNLEAWYEPIDQLLDSIVTSYSLDEARARTPYSPALIQMAKQARREKIRNKTHERERERGGAILRSTILRMRKGPPAHVLSKMTPAQRERDRILRGPSEAGYTGMIKRAAGVKLKNDRYWRLEDGEPHMRAELDRVEREIRESQARRRAKGRAKE
ncbi:hypothetical protein K439DRAFT_1528793 [Ramaria rubella]|nr:hypothetical protein K439DRAFT_1528793 [Ramaria rubella]